MERHVFIEMKVSGLAIDPITNTPIVILKDIEGRRAVPIWIGIFEASAIATEMENIKFPRPMTHDLLNEIIKLMKGEVVRVEISDLRNNTFFANIHLLLEGKTIVVDARPSDAIAIALRAGASIFIEEKVIEKSRNVDFGAKHSDIGSLDKEKLEEFLENLSPEDFGKYKM
ncbi:MAG: bifunctional nuclease family protein [Syntrophales bacterium]